jgi:hypothetical protein
LRRVSGRVARLSRFVPSLLPLFVPCLCTSTVDLLVLLAQHLLTSLTEGGTGKALPPSVKEALLVEIRSYVGLVAVSSAYAFGTQDDVVLSRNVWQASTASYETITQTLTRPLPDEISAFVKQNLAIHFQLEHLARTSEGSRRNEFLRYSYNSHLAMQKYLIETASKTHPEEARKVMWEYRLTFIPEHDKDLPAGMPSPQQDPAFYGLKR